MHQGMQSRQTPDGHHADGDSDQGDDNAAENINEAHLTIVRDRQRKMGMEKQTRRQRAGGGGEEGCKEAIPQWRIVAAIEGLRKNQRGGNRGTEEGADGA